MDVLVDARRSWSSTEVLQELERYGPPLVETLRMLQEEPLASAPLTLSDLGTYPMHQLADAYAFDLYCHLRVDVVVPDGPVERTLPAAGPARLGPAIGWMITGLPQMQGPAFSSVDRPLTLRFTGTAASSWTVSGVGDGFVTVSPGESPDCAAVISSDGHSFLLWGTRRADWRNHVSVEGDEGLASGFLDALNIV